MKNLFSKFDHWTIFSFLVVLNVFDALTTAWLVMKFGPEVESNPLIRYSMHLYGIPGMYMVKFVVLGFLGLMIASVLRLYKRERASLIVKRSMIAMCFLLALVIFNNALLVINTINT